MGYSLRRVAVSEPCIEYRRGLVEGSKTIYVVIQGKEIGAVQPYRFLLFAILYSAKQTRSLEVGLGDWRQCSI